MPGMSHGELRDLTGRVAQGELDAEEVIVKVLSGGDHLAIGGAFTREHHEPTPALRAHTEGVELHWSLVLPDEENKGTTQPVLRASAVAKTAIHSALGNINDRLERIRTSQLITPPDKVYHGGTHGWEYEPNKDDYDLSIHKDVLARTALIADGTYIGVVDFVSRDGFDIDIPGEKGHFASLDTYRTLGSVPITMGLVRRNMGGFAVRHLQYEPLSISHS